jgi:hypothetical protein
MNSIVVLLTCGLFTVTAPVFAASKLCCPCKAADGLRFVATTVPSLPDACAVACSSNKGSAIATEQTWLVDQNASCGFLAPTSQPPSYRSLVVAVWHSIGHQGAPVYRDGPDSDTLRRGQELQAVLWAGESDVQNGAGQANHDIRIASFPDLERATGEALQSCKAQALGLDIKKKFFEIWDARTGPSQVRFRASGIYEAAKAKRYQEIRSVNFNGQGDDRIKGLLSCFSGSEIQQIIDEFVQKDGTAPAAGPPDPQYIKDVNTHGGRGMGN